MNFDHVFIAPKDWEKSLEFYQENLGFQVVSSWGEKPEPRGAVLKSGSFTVIIAEEHASKGDKAWSHGINGERPTIHVSVDDVEEIFEKLTDKESAVVPPENNHWGTRWMVVKDPDDNLLAYNTRQETQESS